MEAVNQPETPSRPLQGAPAVIGAGSLKGRATMSCSRPAWMPSDSGVGIGGFPGVHSNDQLARS